MKHLLLVLLAVTLAPYVRAQTGDREFANNTYVDNIKSVRLNVNGFPHSYPVIELNGNALLRLSFDDLSDDVRRYTYTFTHCNQDWLPSNLGPLEYNSGYANDQIDNYDFSISTLANYIHYDLVFPNRNMRIEKSGNYVLTVYDSEGRDDIPVITRRFMVYENSGGVGAQINRAAEVSKIHTHQEVDFTFNTKQLRPRAPLQEISATVLQNGRWDNAIVGITPNMLARESVRFNYQGKVAFQGANEFRNLDLRSIVAPRTKVTEILNEGTFYSMVLEPVRERANSVYLQYVDFNGDFVIDGTETQLVSFLNENFAFSNNRDFDFAGDYIETTFIMHGLRAPLEKDVYIFGGLSEFQLKPTHRMVWNPSIEAYVGRVFLKQGFYNYLFVTDEGPGTERVGYQRTEDSFSDTENDYTVLVYYRELGGRFDRLVGVGQFNSNQ